MIPDYTVSDVLPPFVGDVRLRASMSPFQSDIREVVVRFATTPERVAILHGLLEYRAALRAIGIETAFQWLSGSFFEDVEKIRKRPPADIDIVTFGRVAGSTNWVQPDFDAFVGAYGHLLDPEQTKALFKCDAYFVDLDGLAESLVDDSRYWFGLFSHQRDTSLWKGMVLVSMDEAMEAEAKALLKEKHA